MTPSANQRGRVGAPIADSSLIVCDAELYPGHPIGMKTFMAAYSSDARIPHVSRIVRSVNRPSAIVPPCRIRFDTTLQVAQLPPLHGEVHRVPDDFQEQTGAAAGVVAACAGH